MAPGNCRSFLINISVFLALVFVVIPSVGCASAADLESHEVRRDLKDNIILEDNGTQWYNLTDSTAASNSSSNVVVGFIGAAVAIVFFGSNLVPVKKADTGDGMFYQWVDCVAIWHVGLIVNIVRGCPQFHPLAMLGGFLWATGNVTVVPIIKTIGLSLGILIWGSLNLLTGWASGHFGLFGIKKDELSNPVFNYIGVSLALVSVVLFLFVKSEVTSGDASSKEPPKDATSRTPLLDEQESTNSEPDIKVIPSEDASWVDRLSPTQKRIVGISLAIVAGSFYGFNFVPCIWIQDNVANASQNGLDYVFSHFSGIILTSNVYFLLYCIFKRNRPQIGVGLVIPSIVSGVMWGIAQSGWFLANFNLSESVSFPIITTGPGIIASLWGVIYFREIQGRRNLLVLFLAFAITITGAVFTAFSK
ncbi:transmembrane protein 144-like isoform X2 [Asterias rubens]|uniref:transmembrane protein 144-like isoform X2 n=1 Tax=Asterias rubens TaxID=7604 RepID=UPI0014555071|nr:transmembrane protein 144-like isoform X2 [Asterias rubens]